MSQTQTTKKRTVGGTIAVDAYCLIDGYLIRNNDDDDDSPSVNEYKRVTIPVTRLPAIFGRDGEETTDDKNFFGMGSLPQFSREHFRIDYWCNERGRLGQSQSEAFQWDYSQNSNELMNPDGVDLSNPFFTVTCLGKNGLVCQKQKVEKDKSIVVEHGAAIQASSFCFYFLSSSNPSYRNIDITSHDSSNKKNKIILDTDSMESPPSKRKRGLTGMQAELDLLSTEELLEQLNTAIVTNVWDRKHQFIGSTLSGRAVTAAAHAPELRRKAALADNALERNEVMDWIAASEPFSHWSQQMLTKLEAKSYQASITNAMVKMGFTRTAEKGRYIKWILPPLSDGGGGQNSSSKEDHVKTKGREESKQHKHDSVRDNKVVVAKGTTKAVEDSKVSSNNNNEKDEKAISVDAGTKESAEQAVDSGGDKPAVEPSPRGYFTQ